MKENFETSEHREHSLPELENSEYSAEFMRRLNDFERRNGCQDCNLLRLRLCSPLAKFEAATVRGEESASCPNRSI